REPALAMFAVGIERLRRIDRPLVPAGGPLMLAAGAHVIQMPALPDVGEVANVIGLPARREALEVVRAQLELAAAAVGVAVAARALDARDREPRAIELDLAEDRDGRRAPRDGNLPGTHDLRECMHASLLSCRPSLADDGTRPCGLAANQLGD